jgi:uncharacterized protein (DUF2249 family)
MPTTALQLIDVRSVPVPDRNTAILGQLDLLGPGESLQLLMDVEPQPTLVACRANRPRAFDWSLLEEGPPAWRVEIHRRRASDTRRGIREYLQWDHERLDLTFQEAIRLAGAGERAAAGVRFAEFRTRLLRHIRMEEEFLFPAFVRTTGQQGPIDQMLQEHEEIQALLERMAGAIASGVPETRFDDIRKRLMTVLGHHNAKEERIIYPTTDQRLPPSEREDLVLAMQEI